MNTVETREWLVLAGLIALCLAVGGLGSVWTSSSVDSWYATLRKPAINPPSWVFGPVWTVLYVLMAVAAWLVWRTAGWPAAAYPLGLWGVQLALNLAWSGLFFALRSPLLGLFDIALLWLALLATTVAFWGVLPLAGWLLVPYLAWVSYAGLLNFLIWRLNP